MILLRGTIVLRFFKQTSRECLNTRLQSSNQLINQMQSGLILALPEGRNRYPT